VILAGDIGGTRARLALYAPKGKKPLRQQVFESRAFPSLEAVLRVFLGLRPPKIAAATFGIAGPVVNNRATATNLPWQIDGRTIARKLGIKKVTLINDLVALALGAHTVSKSKLVVIQGDAPPRKKGANVAVIAAGTGLGEAALIWDGARFVPLGTEGGHTDFAPRDDLEMDLLRWLKKKVGGRVSYERILSGAGLGNVYDFLREAKGAEEPREVSDAIARAADRNAEISASGLAGKSEASARAVELFATIYGAEAGNLALKMLATGGVYVAGGVAAFMAPVLVKSGFVRAFTDKGRFAPVMQKMPVAIVKDPYIGLAGSAYHALHANH
jgi:glucokinase